MHDAVPVLGVEQTKVQHCHLWFSEQTELILMETSWGVSRKAQEGSFLPAPPGLEAEIEAFVLELGIYIHWV